jgi:hypothetical protein
MADGSLQHSPIAIHYTPLDGLTLNARLEPILGRFFRFPAICAYPLTLLPSLLVLLQKNIGHLACATALQLCQLVKDLFAIWLESGSHGDGTFRAVVEGQKGMPNYERHEQTPEDIQPQYVAKIRVRARRENAKPAYRRCNRTCGSLGTVYTVSTGPCIPNCALTAGLSMRTY